MEQEEIKIKKLFEKHCTKVKGVYYINTNFRESKGGYSQLDELVLDIQRLWKTRR